MITPKTYFYLKKLFILFKFLMAAIRKELVYAAYNRAHALSDSNILDLDSQYELGRQLVLADDSLTKDEKSLVIKYLNQDSDYNKLFWNKGTKRICENCQDECLATLYCEHCIRNYLKAKFSNWTSGNNDIDGLIQKCQMETIAPDRIVEWIPCNNLQNIKYLTKGGCSEIYTADWIDGRYDEWDSKEKQLKRVGRRHVILKKLENVESANRSWFDEGKSHLTISTNGSGSIVQCYGLTKDPSDENYMLLMSRMNMNLKIYLQQNHNKLTWKERIRIAYDIIDALVGVHQEKAIHRDLHSGNILFGQFNQRFPISDLGFCGPADKPLNSIYGNLPYIAPEVIAGKETTFASDIYSIGMLMWEISSGQPPFAGFDHDYDLAMNIMNGIRPKIMPETPLRYKELMVQCWDADPTKRPNIRHLLDRIEEINRSNYQNDNKQINNNANNSQLNQFNTYFKTNSGSTSSIVRNFSKLHIFEDLPEPRNVTKEEQEAYHSMQNDLSIPDNIVFEDQTGQNISTMIIDNSEIGVKSKRIHLSNSDDEKEDLTVNSKKLKLCNNETYVQYTDNAGLQYVPRNYIASSDDDETYNNPNLHSEDQDELEILEELFKH